MDCTSPSNLSVSDRRRRPDGAHPCLSKDSADEQLRSVSARHRLRLPAASGERGWITQPIVRSAEQ